MRLPAIADAHCHYWTPGTHRWLQAVPPKLQPISRDYLPTTQLEDLTGLDLRETVYIQAQMHASGEFSAQEEVAWADGMAAACGRPNAVIGHAPLQRPQEAAAVIDACCRFKTYRGVRFMLDYHPSRPELCQAERGDHMSSPAFLEGIRLLGPRGLLFELQVCQCQLAEAAHFVSKAPEVTFMLNHAGFPLRGEHAAWREGMQRLAGQPNVACKLGGFGACDEEAFSTEETRRYVGDCLELFGVDRCMFASNLPVDLVTMTPRQRWADLGASVQGRGLTTPQLEALFRGNCLRYYGIKASAPPSPPQTLAPSAPPLHVKARGQHPLYPARATVADDQVSWAVGWAEYTPVDYTAEKVLANDVTVNPSGWADPPDPSVLEPHVWAERDSSESPLLFNAKRFPMNPRGRSGMGGRGLLGKWGPNFAADPIVTRWRAGASLDAPPRLQVVVIERRDTGEWALPGGMVDAAETVSAAVRREFEEEAGNLEGAAAQATFRRLTDELFSSGVVVYEGYVDDPRNTDHAWMETTAVHLHCSDALGEALPLNAGDDAKAVRWVDVGGPEHATLYADHKDWVDCAEARLLKLRGGAGSPFRAPKLPAAVARGAVHVALAAALCAPLGPSMALFVPPAAAAQIQSPTAQVTSLLDAGATRSDPLLKAAVQSLLDEAAPAAAVDFAQSQGTWRVVSAPLFDTISRIALTNLEVTYRIGAGGTIGATVRYESRLVGSGWLCTDGTIKNVDGAPTPTVSLVWERIWWQPGGEANAPPTDPEVEGAAALRPLVQTLGRLGFSPELAVFPVRYVDSDAGIAVFKFQDLTVAVRRTS